MGSFAYVFKDKGSVVPENKREELAQRIEVLCQAGGMMQVEQIQLHGITVILIRKAQMKENGMDFIYNYFEDAFWENAGFNIKKSRVWSGKIGWSHFAQAVIAAHVLEEQYTEGVSIVMMNGEPVSTWKYVGWINYLFDEVYHVKNLDSWKLFEAMHYSTEIEEWQDEDYYNFGNERFAFISRCEVCAVLNGTEKALELYNVENKQSFENSVRAAMRLVVGYMKFYKEKGYDLSELIRMTRLYYESGCIKTESEGEILLEWLEFTDAPAFVIKAISEVYQVDFWELWDQVRDVVRRVDKLGFGEKGYHVVPVSTMDLFRQSPDDMIPYWKENCDFELSETLWEWFHSLKMQYDDIISSDFCLENPLHYILSLMKEVDDNYYQIYTFSEFFEETLENLKDIRYQALWKIYDDMIHDDELKKAGEVIFVPEGPEHEHEGIHYWGEETKRRLKRTWDIMSLQDRNNKARVTFRRYMALVANKALRVKVFGF